MKKNSGAIFYGIMSIIGIVCYVVFSIRGEKDLHDLWTTTWGMIILFNMSR